ncbi:MAG TPA: preQ(1) synthase [Paenibacillaceae bacterium]
MPRDKAEDRPSGAAGSSVETGPPAPSAPSGVSGEAGESASSGLEKSGRAPGLTLLGSGDTRYEFSYNPDLLETFENRHPDRDYFVKFNCPEFTTLCPITGQPDFGTIYISYIPDRKMVESKSLKLYLFSFRNHGGFHEDCVNTIMNDLIRVMEPRYIEVWGKFMPRGGISIDPFCNWGRPGTKYERMAEYRLLNHDMYPEKVDNR